MGAHLNSRSVLAWLAIALLAFAAGGYGFWKYYQNRRQRLMVQEQVQDAIAWQVQHPNEDFPGRDLKTVPRYPGSIRLAFSEQKAGDGTVYLVSYKCADSLRNVSSFYELQMPEHGWVLATKDESFLHMVFARKEAVKPGPPLLQFYFTPSSDDRETMISIIALDNR